VPGKREMIRMVYITKSEKKFVRLKDSKGPENDNVTEYENEVVYERGTLNNILRELFGN
jgi:hypothetical protein